MNSSSPHPKPPRAQRSFRGASQGAQGSWSSFALTTIGMAAILQLFFFVGMQVGTLHSTYNCPDSSATMSALKSSMSSLKRGTGSKPKSSQTKSYQLASLQSFGFFDDIDDETWRRHQKRALTAQDHQFPKEKLKNWWTPAVWYMNNYQPVFTCPNVRRVGGVGDGAKWTCDPHRLISIAEQRKQDAIRKQGTHKIDQAYCLIYSIGSGGKFEWEDGLLELVGNKTCEVHIFDPGNYQDDSMEQRNIYYHKWGIKSSNNMTEFKPKFRGRYKSFQQSIHELGHNQRTIDILKIDCESCEWFCYQDFVTAGDVRQILIKTHGIPYPEEDKRKTKVWPYSTMDPTEYFNAFKQNNFFLFSKEIDWNPSSAGIVVEWGYIKLRYDFLVGGGGGVRSAVEDVE